MKLPKKIKILSRDYTVENLSTQDAANSSNFGECDINQGIIKLDSQWSNQKQAQTLLHEILHGIYNAMAMELEIMKKEEDIVLPIANGLSCVMRDNPKTFAEIMRALK